MRVLVVEDEGLVAMLLEDMLRDLGCEVIGPAGSIDEAFACVRTTMFEGALLDLNLRGEPIFPVADALAARRIPFVFVTGYGHEGMLGHHSDRPTLSKPFDLSGLTRAVESFRPLAPGVAGGLPAGSPY